MDQGWGGVLLKKRVVCDAYILRGKIVPGLE